MSVILHRGPHTGYFDVKWAGPFKNMNNVCKITEKVLLVHYPDCPIIIKKNVLLFFTANSL